MDENKRLNDFTNREKEILLKGLEILINRTNDHLRLFGDKKWLDGNGKEVNLHNDSELFMEELVSLKKKL